MSSPTTGGEDVTEEFAEELEERARDVLEGGEFVTFEEHEEQRD